MTAQILSTELSSLIQDSKRRNPDLRNAAEKSLSELKALPNTSEAQLAAGLNHRPARMTSIIDLLRDLKNRPNFVNPFVIACRTGNSKYAPSGITCLLRLVVSNGLSPETLKDVLEAFRECASLALDVQLKVLQALPSLLQNYSRSLEGSLLISAIQVCFILHGSKTAVASNTAAASLQQLLAFTFEKLAPRDDSSSSDESLVAVPIQDGSILVSNAAADAYYLLNDICLLTSGKQPKTLHGSSLSPAFGLELIESALVIHIDLVIKHREQIYVLRDCLMPFLIQTLSERASFAVTVRSMRLLRLLTRRLLSAMPMELEIAIDLINHTLNPKGSPEWKRALCLEFFREIHGDPKLLRAIYAQYDEQDGRKSLVSDHLAVLVRLAAEKPTIIGLGQQISEAGEQANAEQIAVESGGITGAIATAAVETSLDKPGLNVQWSTIRTPCMDLIDKVEPPLLPVTYIYALVLTCITGFSEGLAKFLLPFTIPTDSKPKRKRASASGKQGQQKPESKEDGEGSLASTKASAGSPQPEGNLPVNPMALENHEQYDQICTAASIVEECWPALLATSSTFLNASLDSEYLHTLIRSFQKFTQVAGLLNLGTPRDAFLTTLAKHAVPTPLGDFTNTPDLGSQENSEDDDVEDRSESEDDSGIGRGVFSRNSREAGLRLTPITTRNLLCLRALLNLGIALGPVLKESWTIIIETLHQVDSILNASDMKASQAHRKATSDDNGLAAEKEAVETTVSRLFQSTSDLPDQAYLQILDCFSILAYNVSGISNQLESGANIAPSNMLSPQARHRRFPSISGLNMNKAFAAKDNMRILDRMGQIAQHNTGRLSRMELSGSGWSVFVNLFTDHLSSPAIIADVRVGAARKLNKMLDDLISSTNDANVEQQNELTTRCLDALATAISSLWKSTPTKSVWNCSLEIHAMGLETLTWILEQRGEVLRSGWETVFAIVASAVETAGRPPASGVEKSLTLSTPTPCSPRLVRLSFASLQLICSDFLTSVSDRYFLTLLDTLSYFCSQDQDFNISLTSINFLRNISDFLQRKIEDVESLFVDANVAKCRTERDLVGLVDAEGSGGSLRSAIWLFLLLHLAQLINDDRLEVRNSALHTLFGIVDACADRLGVEAWITCFRIVFFKLLAIIEATHEQESKIVDNEDSSWDETAVLLVQRLSKTFMQALEVLSEHDTFSFVSKQLLTQYAKLLGRRRLRLSRAVFTGLTEILAGAENKISHHKLPLDSAWAIWRDNNPSTYDLRGTTDNHDALIAYLQYTRQLHGLLDGGFNNTQAEAILVNHRLAITQSTAVVYGSDIDEMTTVQELALENMKLIPTSPVDILVKLVEEIAFLVTLAFQARDDQIVKGKTYVALSKAAMVALEDLVKQHCVGPDPPTAHLLSLSFRALEVPIHLKYKWQYEGKGTPTWKKAISTALSLLDADLLRRCAENASGTQSMWEGIVGISDGIAVAHTDDCESMSAISIDQAFDIESFSQLVATIIPTLGTPSIPDKICRKYVESIFQHSIIHEPHPDDLARPDQELLDGLRSQHVGRVQDLPPRLRLKMAYTLLDQLFDLVAVYDGSVERVKLAQAAAPYLILRTGLVLKAYVCDQPLRGRMPQPLSQKREMHYVLKRLVELKSEPRAFPETMGVQSEHKKHLFLLFGLVTKALKAAWRDEEMSAALRRVLDAVGADFGL
ncbi:MAG: hypothetical protein Q9225_005039 [Loekoesia sp. 1 TL-2023]